MSVRERDYEVTLRGIYTRTVSVSASDADEAGVRAVENFSFSDISYDAADEVEVVEVGEEN